ncbi:hypothetical protein LZD49_12000 [Dyadobacter sp. CY261]|uniref:hypothetical protein n=1 Tax=Dyadobacter sp. CY261 TaxID=2907203 RepID=UPI001F355032|nr:hypothetical protein [Dyadobacter sp. CY261]MCF0071194.1 hypothetical protein [Dyadobacter sp. CY261]
MSRLKSLLICTFLLFLFSQTGFAQILLPAKEFDVKEAKQAVAVDAQYFYVINNSTITKHSKANGKIVATWDGAKEGIVHLNSGVVIEGRLYCANSNYPEIPMTSSVEIFDVKTLTHVDTHSFGIAQHGSLTWLDQKDGHWFIGFAHYAGKESSEGRDVRWTSLVKYDMEWRQVEAWVFPKNLIDLFTPKSNSGGAWGADGLLYCTGHDRAEVYVLKLPKSGYTLEYIRTLPAPIEGQGIAIDRAVPGKALLYGIQRSKHTVTVSEIR